jgi:hypothetical protein
VCTVPLSTDETLSFQITPRPNFLPKITAHSTFLSVWMKNVTTSFRSEEYWLLVDDADLLRDRRLFGADLVL